MPERKKTLPQITVLNAAPPYDEEDGDYKYFVDGEDAQCAERLPFRFDATRYEPLNAWWLCEAATLAYSDPRLVEETFTQKAKLPRFKAFATDGGTECFVASNDDFAIVAFRGSELTTRDGSPRDFRQIFNDWRRDADIRTSNSVNGAKLHRGFADGVSDVWEDKQGREGLGNYLGNLPARKVWFTGHSLGAALATLAAARALAGHVRLGGLYTFGSPRVGDRVFAENFGRMLAERGLTYYRFVNGEDVVTTVPLVSKLQLSFPPVVRFKHAGTLRHIDREGRISEDPTKVEQLQAKVLGLLPIGVAGGIDQRFLDLIPNAVGDHVPTLYSTHIWNAYAEGQGGGD